MAAKGRLKKQSTVSRQEICSFLSDTLSLSSITDLSCNGLQVEGCDTISTIGLAVDACTETYRLAAASSCEMLLVHHGIIWGGLRSVTGRTRSHLDFLIRHNMNLYAAHLPLDLHAKLGNNAYLASLLRLNNKTPFGVYKGTTIGVAGSFVSPKPLDAIVDTLCRSLDTECTVLPFGKTTIKTVGIVSGGASDLLAEAIDKNLDCYITGESSHENYHDALEANINVIYAGHYHTEKGGVLSLGKLLESTFGIRTVFIDVPVLI